MESAIDLIKENIANRNPVLKLLNSDLFLNYDREKEEKINQLIGECSHLEVLRIYFPADKSSRQHGNGYIKLPTFLSQPALKNLKTLCLESCTFLNHEDITILNSFIKLEELELPNCFFNDLTFLIQLPKLKKLDISFTSKLQLHFISALSNLEELDISYCGITNLSQMINHPKLKELNAANNKITSISPLTDLPDLEILNLSFNELLDIKLIENLKNIKRLLLNNTRISSMDEIATLPLIEELSIAYNGIEVLIFPASGLKVLSASGNWITEIKNADNQNKLETLLLSSCRLKNEEEFGKLVHLRYLDLGHNDLTSINGLTNLLNLETLHINNNNIIDINRLQKLPKLRKLNMQGNAIKMMSEVIFENLFSHHYKLSFDTILFLKNAVLQSKHHEKASMLQDIERKMLFGGPIQEAEQKEISSLIGEMLILPNPLVSPGVDVIAQGNEAIQAFYTNLKVSELIPFREAKVILLGEPDAGKSNLLNYFLGIPFSEEKSVTQGVRISRYNFWDGTDEYRINFWDFGGQEVQQSLHQYFLTDNTLYLIILNAVTDEQPDKYLKFLDNHAPNSPFFIITNKDDLNARSNLKANLISTKYETRWQQSEYRISLKQADSLQNCNDNKVLFEERNIELQKLFTAVRKTFLQLPHIEQGFLSNYKNVKHVVEEMYEKKKKPYITMQEFIDCCKEHGIANGTEKGLLSQLNFIGTVRYLDENNLRGIHILNPEWLSDGMYKIITNGWIKSKMRGKVKKKDIVHILQPSCSTDYTYHAHEIDYLITLMSHFRVAYFDERDRNIYLPDAFPDDLPSELKKTNFISDAKHYYFSYETEIPSYIIIRFIVKMFKYVKGSQYWNRGIVLEYKEHRSNYCDALIEENDRTIDIWIRGKDIQGFFFLIRDALRNAHEERFKAWTEMIDLGDYQVDYNDVLTYRYGGETEIKTPEIDPFTGKLRVYNINEVLGRFEVIKEQEQTLTINTEGGDFYVNGLLQGRINRQKIRLNSQAQKTNPAVEAYKRKMLRKWQRNAWILFILSLALTIAGFIMLQQEYVPWLKKEAWDNFRKSNVLKLSLYIVGVIWNLFIAKLWYERIFDRSKIKAFLEMLKIPKGLS
ncbi:hypothetical protein GFS24_17665 [Chitinophaga sp. SYP-B3965]|uniref:leucine-rich repeat domain-containing protein n=1 Tax=Chitinophaga sp. SYP-B3965 TaxID=2663120 RepID=UPI001299D2AA|nr:leucine-rich repeat domain-containing protein [Chitinophaga sp. SYP-B3965]MRG46954.1 hypothetical protein [Chitinophaga sp. SYP-B3965]